MTRRAPRLALALAFLVTLSLCLPSAKVAQAVPSETGGITIAHFEDNKVCVGDSVRKTVTASVDLSRPGYVPTDPTSHINVEISAVLGKVTPSILLHTGDFATFDFTYTALAPGQETLTAELNDGVSIATESFKVEVSCDYDVHLLEVIHFTVDVGGDTFRSLTIVTGNGKLKHETSNVATIFDGSGTWKLVETILSKPSECVQYSSPPLYGSGAFDLLGAQTAPETVEVGLYFQAAGANFSHGTSVCVDSDGGVGMGWSAASGGNQALAGQIRAEVPIGGGMGQGKMTGKGVDMVRAQASQWDYLAQLILVPR